MRGASSFFFFYGDLGPQIPYGLLGNESPATSLFIQLLNCGAQGFFLSWCFTSTKKRVAYMGQGKNGLATWAVFCFCFLFFDWLIKLYFSTVKILAQRQTHIFAVATVLLITKRERERDALMVYCLWFKTALSTRGDKINVFSFHTHRHRQDKINMPNS